MKKLMIILLLLLASIAGAIDRIPNDSTDRIVFFIAVDVTDLFTRETALDTFTVYYVLDDGSVAAMTDPTTSPVSNDYMPGLYSLAIDEAGMTNMDAGNDFETLTLHITHASMSPVTMKVEVYRPKITAGQTATVAAGVIEALVTATNDIDLSATQKTSINAEVDTALNTAIPAAGSLVDGSINERIKSVDELTESGGDGDLAAIKTLSSSAGTL